MRVSFLDLSRETSRTCFQKKVLSNVKKILDNGTFLFGKNFNKLEAKLSKMFEAEAVLVKSGTDAIALSLMVNGIGHGKRVAIPAFSAIPTAAAVIMTGATPVYVDVSIRDAGISIELLADVIDKVDAVVPVHLYGQPADMPRVMDACKNKIVIEDCAQAFGSKIDGVSVGKFGQCGAFSFYPSKNLGACGDAGFIITKDSCLASKLRELRFYGQKNSYVMGDSVGINSRIDEMQCAIILEKLKEFPKVLNKRMNMFEKYLKEVGKFSINWNSGATPHLMPIITSDREKFILKMKDNEISTLIHYPFTLPKSVSKSDEKFIVAEEYSKNVVSIPFNPWLTDAECDYVLEATKRNINSTNK